MSSVRRNWSLLAVFALVLGAFAVTSLRAQVVTIAGKAKLREPFHTLIALPNNQMTTITSVPAGRTLVVTDVVASNRNSASARIQITPFQLILPVPAEDTFGHAFNTGPVVNGGTDLQAINLNGTQDLELYVTGYFVKN